MRLDTGCSILDSENSFEFYFMSTLTGLIFALTNIKKLDMDSTF